MGQQNKPVSESTYPSSSSVPRTPHPDRGRGSGLLVRLAVAFTIALVLAMTALIGMRWHKVPEPTTGVVVYGDRSLDGAKILVDAFGASDRAGHVEASLNEDNNYRVTILRYPGRYHVAVTVPGQYRPIDDEEITLAKLRGTLIDLPTYLTIIGDDSMADAEVMISSKTHVFSGKLVSANKFRIRMLVPPDQYSLSVLNHGINQTEDDVTVLPHTPKEVDLRKKS